MSDSPPCDAVTQLVFLRKEAKHQDEKPYKLQYDPGEYLPRTNCINEPADNITVHDIRGRENEYTFDVHGFEVSRLQSALAPEEFFDEEKVKKIYYSELKDLLKSKFGARRVEILEHGVRRRHPKFPISTGEDYDYLQPTSVVHIDFTPDAARRASEELLHVSPTEYDRMQCLNIWKPLRGPVTDWPLAVCDARTVNPEKDLVDTDVVTRTGFTENYQIYPSNHYKWYYLNDQMADEVVLFRQTDTDENHAIGVPHAGFKNPEAKPSERPRESIEARAFVYY